MRVWNVMTADRVKIQVTGKDIASAMEKAQEDLGRNDEIVSIKEI